MVFIRGHHFLVLFRHPLLILGLYRRCGIAESVEVADVVEVLVSLLLLLYVVLKLFENIVVVRFDR